MTISLNRGNLRHGFTIEQNDVKVGANNDGNNNNNPIE
jgi:hypothetical protein